VYHVRESETRKTHFRLCLQAMSPSGAAVSQNEAAVYGDQVSGGVNLPAQQQIYYFVISVDWLATQTQALPCFIQVSVNLPRRE